MGVVMRSIWMSLAWKEWREQAWKLVALTAVLCGVATLVIIGVDSMPASGSYWMVLVSLVPLSIFMGATAATSERARGTLAFLQASPVAAWKLAIGELVGGLATLVIAIGFVFTWMYLLWYLQLFHAGDDYNRCMADLWRWTVPSIALGNWFVSAAATAMATSVSIYLWTAAVGINRADEISAGARLILVIAAWWMLVGYAGTPNGKSWVDSMGWTVWASIVAVSPGGTAIGLPKLPNGFEWMSNHWPLVIGVVAHLGLATWFVVRFAKGAESVVRSPRTAKPFNQKLDWLGPPRHSQLGAIAWKQFRESGPIVVASLAGMLVISAMFTIAHIRDVRNRPELLADVVGLVTMALALPTVLVVGIGVSLNDLGPKLNTFWRSRPIDPDLWYWTKFAAGLIALVAAMLVPLAILAAAVRFGGANSSGRSFLNDGVGREMIVIFLAIYSVAVATTCLIRQAVYAAILAIGTLLIAPIVVLIVDKLGHQLFGNAFGDSFFAKHEGQICLIALCAVSIAVLMLGWLATRYDRGTKGQ
jgi:ABC-type transport system involved in multi-copper enzyme maturation permease subunit